MAPPGGARLGQGIALEASLQDALDSGVARLFKQKRPAAGRFQATLPILPTQSQQGLDRSQPIKRAITQEPLDHVPRCLTYLRCATPAPGRCRHQERRLVRRVVDRVRAPHPRRCPPMRGHTLVVMIDLHLTPVGAYPQPPSDQPVRGRVVGTLHHHVTVGMQLRLLPDPQVVRAHGQLRKCGLLHRLESLQRPPLHRPMDPPARHSLHPLQDLRIGLGDGHRLTAGQEVALHILHTALHLPLREKRVLQIVEMVARKFLP